MPIASSLHFLHLNDLHGCLTEAVLPVVSGLKTDSSLVLDSGDCIRTGNLGIPIRPEPVWDLFAQIPVAAGTIGNRETHVLAGAFEAKISGAKHPLLCANMVHRRDHSAVLPAHLMLDHGGIRLGIVGVSVAMVTEKMATRAASAFLWTDPVKTGAEVARKLRSEVDVLIAITHIGFAKDRALAEAAPEIDIIFGGHSHTVLNAPEKVNQSWIVQGGSHARFVGSYEFDLRRRELTGQLMPLKRADSRAT